MTKSNRASSPSECQTKQPRKNYEHPLSEWDKKWRTSYISKLSTLKGKQTTGLNI